MQLQAYFIGNAHQIDKKSECCYIYGNWNPYCSSCIGLIIENGMFEYRDIYTNQFIRYKIIDTTNNNTIINKTWLHFIFINKYEILFAFENDNNMYKTLYQPKLSQNNIINNKSIFPNNINTLNNNNNISFYIELRFESPNIIKCFDTDLNFKHIFCGLSNGNILIGSIDSNLKSNIKNNNNIEIKEYSSSESDGEEEEEEELLLIENCHTDAITAICGSLLNAFITSSKDSTVKIWDFSFENNNNITILHCIDDIFKGTEEITLIHPFRSYLNNFELLSICTIEGIIFIFLLNDNYKLLNILNIKYQSEILDISTMNDGIILAISTLNGYIYLFDTINFNQISYEKLSEKPIVFGKYKKNNNDFLFMDYNGKFKLYPQTQLNTQYTQSDCNTNTDINEAESNPIPLIETETTSSVFTINTPKINNNNNNNDNKNVFSNTTISSTNTPFYGINNRKNNNKKYINNPLKTKTILNQMNDGPISNIYSIGKSSSISTFYKKKINKVKNSKFNINKHINQENDKKIMDELQKKHLQRKLIEEQRRRKMESIYGSLPIIPNKNELIQKGLKNNNNKKQYIINNNNNNNKYMLKPSLKPFIKRSLEPERRNDFNNNRHKKKNINTNNLQLKKKTISFTKKMTFWNKTTFNQLT